MFLSLYKYVLGHLDCTHPGVFVRTVPAPGAALLGSCDLVDIHLHTFGLALLRRASVLGTILSHCQWGNSGMLYVCDLIALECVECSIYLRSLGALGCTGRSEGRGEARRGVVRIWVSRLAVKNYCRG